MSNLVPFGKYKGQPIEALMEDQQYCQWLMAQDWFRARFQSIYTVIINNGTSATETPEHNELQIRFLDDDFCLKFFSALQEFDIFRVASNELIAKSLQKVTRDWQAWLDKQIDYGLKHWRDGMRELRELKPTDKGTWREDAVLMSIARDEKELQQMKDAPRGADAFDVTPPLLVRVHKTFETAGIDVRVTVATGFKCSLKEKAMPFHVSQDFDVSHIKQSSYGVELKPIVGDDFPAILRQMKANESDVLVYGEYRGIGATEEQFRQYFYNEDFDCITLAEILAAPMPACDREINLNACWGACEKDA